MRIDFTCEVCGIAGSRRYTKGKVPTHFFCSTACQNEWQKSRLIPLSQGGSTNIDNLVMLYSSCHKIVEDQTRNIHRIIPDWPVVQLFVKERLHCI